MRRTGRPTKPVGVIRTPDQRIRVFVSSTLGELSAERARVREGIERLRMSPVLFELGARPHPPRELYRAYLQQCHIFIGIYWQRYGWVAPGEQLSGLEDEYQLSAGMPRLIYIKEPAADREPQLTDLLRLVKGEDQTSYKRFTDADDLATLVERDLTVLVTERFEAMTGSRRGQLLPSAAPPLPLTETVGRAAEVDAVLSLLAQDRRLITLTGPGGVGKTRLALEVAGRIDDRYGGGAHFVQLAPITEPELALHTIADQLGIPVEGTRGPAEALADRLSGSPTLLVLDNLEQVAAVGAQVASLLERCPGLQILATSRQALRVRGERDFPVVPLPLPDAELPLSELAEQPAVRLFVERARDASAGFDLDAHNARDVAELCRRLDGLPLGIELAAARSRLLPPAALLERLDARPDALGDSRSDRPERQRTLRATIDWSHELLDRSERVLFARLGVFAGGFSLAAADAVCAGDGIDVLETLASLLDKNLVAVAPGDHQVEPRFQMLETVRTYAGERLLQLGEDGRIHRRHLDWYLELSERAQPFLCGPGQREWAARFDPERANLRTAVRTALASADDDAVVELTWDVIVFYFIRDAVYEPEGWLRQVADAGRPLSEVISAKLRSLRALMAIHRGEFDGAREALESALEVFGSRSMDFETAVTLKELAWVRYVLDHDAIGAADALQQSSRMFEALNHDWGVSVAELQLGSLFSALGDLAGAEVGFKRSWWHAERIDNAPLMAQALQFSGVICVLSGRGDDAIPLIARAAALLRPGRHETETASCLEAIAGVALARSDGEAAARALTVAAAVRRKLGIGLWPSARPFVSGLIDEARGGLGPDRFDALAAQADRLDPFDVLDGAVRELRPADGPDR